MKRRDFIAKMTLGAAALAAPATLGAAPAKKRKPNIIYILADDLGYGDLGCYGQKDIKTPNIDRMAEEGMRLTDHYAGSALCAPSRCVLITGLHTGHCYIRNNKPLPFEGNAPIPADSQTIGKIMKKAGYATGAMGKWGLGYPGSEGDPNNQGFDHFFGYNCQRQAHSYYPDHLWRNDKKFMLEGNVDKKEKTDYSHDLLTKEALWFIRENQKKPFFLYIPYTIPHTKFEAPELGEYADKPWEDNHKIQAAMISRMDRDVGRILALLKELNLDENTLVIFTSDNGPHGAGGTLERFKAAGPLRGKKSTFYEGGIREPFVARWPEMIKAGTKSGHVSAFWDMLPTFAELAGADVPGRTDGISMVPTLLGRKGQKKHDFLYWELGSKRAVRMGDWKAVQPKGMTDPKSPIELYNLKGDIGEQNDLAAKRPDIVKKIAKIFEDSHEYTPFFDVTFMDEKKPAKQKGGRKKEKR